MTTRAASILTLLAGAPLFLGACTNGNTAASDLQPRRAAQGYAQGTVGYDREKWQQLLSDNDKIRRLVVHTPTGVETTTESDDPAVARLIREHAADMQARMKIGSPVRVWDPVFRDLFASHDKITIELTPTDKGVRAVESCPDPVALAILRSHAMGVSEFVREGHASARRETPRFAVGDPLPAPELSIGGVPHRILSTQPDAAQIAGLEKSGVRRIVNFRKPAEHEGYDEAAAARACGTEYTSLPFAGAAELTDEIIDASRSALRDADQAHATVALHCRTGNRVGPAWVAYRVLDRHVPLEQALAEARLGGMKDPKLEQAARDYVARHSSPAK